MIGLLFVALFQAAAGAPQATPATDPPTSQTNLPAQTGASGDQSTPSNTDAQTHDLGIRCQSETNTGSLMHHRRCSTAEQRRQAEINKEHDHSRMNHESITIVRSGSAQ